MEKGTERDNEIELDIKDLFMELVSFWQVILLTLALGAVIAFAVSRFLMTPLYESTSELYVLSKSTAITSLADIQTGTSLTNDYMVVVKGRPVLEQVIANLGLHETYGSLRRKVSLENPSNSRILMITVRDENPLIAKTVADQIAEVGSDFIAMKMDQDAPTIIQYGYADGEPVSPNTMKNTMIGGFLGMLLAVAIIVLSYLFNDTIVTAEDVEKKLGLNVLGSLPLEDAEDDGESVPAKKGK
ncbi:MAG: capsular biosynthesis protein [Agathobacter sp.]|nr:capsular biosynthesis protein [Agathobacter sp.]